MAMPARIRDADVYTLDLILSLGSRQHTRSLQAPLTPPESIKNMIAKISSVSPEVNGKFFAVKGDPGSTKMEEEDW